MATRAVLAWDLGTSGAKAGIVTPDGRVLASEFEPTPLMLLPDGGAEQDADDWWNALCKATERLLARDIVPRDSIAAIGVTAQWSTTVPVDQHGKALDNAIIWMDSRGARHIRKLTGGAVRVAGYGPIKLMRWMRLTGGAPGHSGKDPLAHILFLKNERPAIYDRARYFLEAKDYLTFRLTGTPAATFDSIALHWLTDNRDPHHIRYDTSLLDLAGIPREKLPDLCPAIEKLGPLLPGHCERFGLPNNVIVVAGAPDVHSAAIGAGTTRDAEAHLYIGTSSWISSHVPHKKTDINNNMAALPAAIPGRYLLLNEQETAGACLSQLSEKLFFPSDALNTPAPSDVFKRLDDLAAKISAGSEGLFFLPWLYGERTPVEDHSLRGGWFNYSLAHERAHLVRSVLEGVAYNSRWLFSCVERFCGGHLDSLRFIGGGAESALWAQIFADVIDRPILRVEQPKLSNLRGAALIAFCGIGELDFDAVPSRVKVASTTEPRRANREVYDRGYDTFRTLHKTLQPVFKKLNP